MERRSIINDMTLTIEDQEALAYGSNQVDPQLHDEAGPLSTDYSREFLDLEPCPHCADPKQHELGCPFPVLSVDPPHETTAIAQSNQVPPDKSLRWEPVEGDAIGEPVAYTPSANAIQSQALDVVPQAGPSNRLKRKLAPEEIKYSAFTENCFDSPVFHHQGPVRHTRNPGSCLGCFAAKRKCLCHEEGQLVSQHKRDSGPLCDRFCYRQNLFDSQESPKLTNGLLDFGKDTIFIRFKLTGVSDTVVSEQSPAQHNVSQIKWVVTDPDSKKNYTVYIEQDTDYQSSKVVPRGGLLGLPTWDWYFSQTSHADEQLKEWRKGALPIEEGKILLSFVSFAKFIWYLYLEISKVHSLGTTPDQIFYLNHLEAYQALLEKRLGKKDPSVGVHVPCHCVPVDKLCGACATTPGSIIRTLMVCWSRLAMGFKSKAAIKTDDQQLVEE